MISSIRTKIFTAIFLVSLLIIGGMTVFMQWTFERRVLEYVNEQETRALTQLEDNLITFYRTNQDWSVLKNQPKQWMNLARRAYRSSFMRADGDDNRAPLPFPPPPLPHWHDNEKGVGGLPPRNPPDQARFDRYVERLVLLDAQKQLVQGDERTTLPPVLSSLKLDNQVIGYLGLYSRQKLTEKVDVDFAQSLQRTVWSVGLVSLVIAVLISLLLSQHLVKPIQALRRGTRQLAEGNYALRMTQYGSDELGQLTHDFNALAERLQQNEQCRKQWIADIAHELRTPLAILRGEIEALQDGINQPDAPTLASLHQEVCHLQRLVGDLYDLSMSDNGALSYRKEPCDILALLRESLSLYASTLQEQQLLVDTSGVVLQPQIVHGDAQRLQQLFKNLLENSVRYTDKPGQLRIAMWSNNQRLHIRWQDSAPGVPDESLARLFERLYRVESSRNRATGGAGLGLSICHNIVAAHDGTIQAAHSPLGGLEINISLPLMMS